MDRRGFLTLTGAAAVAAGAATTGASPMLASTLRLRLAVEDGYDGVGFGADRLARRLEWATGGRFRIARVRPGEACDFSVGGGERHLALHPGFTFFAALPAGEGLGLADLATWLAVGGGQPLWAELAYPFGWKLLLAGHAGDGIGLWSNRRLEAATDLAGERVAVRGLLVEVVAALGGHPVSVVPHALKAALADGSITAAESVLPLASAAADLRALAPRLYRPGLNPAGGVITLAVARPLWEELTAADRRRVAACAAEAYGHAVAEGERGRALAAAVRGTAKWPVLAALPERLSLAAAEATRAVLAAAAGHDATSRRIAASYRAHRARCQAADA